MANQGRRRAGHRSAARPRPSRAGSAATTPAGDRSSRRYGTSRGKPRRGWRRFVSWKAFGLYALGFGLLGAAGVGVGYAMTDIPEANDFARSESTIVYWNDGKTELGRFSAQNRETVDISVIPQACQDAVVAAEDRSFYDNSGFDLMGIARAGVGYLRNTGSTAAGGGSTITQQYVKNYYLVHDQTLTRKVKELFIAVKIDRQLDKDDILAAYLNTIWFGRGVYGIQTASRSYFGKPVSELGLAECAGLAAILRSPARYDPTLGEENARRFTERVRYVLNGMVTIGALDEQAAATTEPPAVVPEKKTDRYGGPNGYLLQQVRKELLRLGVSEADLDTGGLRVVTTFDQKAQQAAVQAVADQRPQEHADGVRVGLAAVRPGNGAVVAMYGGPDAVDQPFNDAIDARIQGGSTVKPFTLAAALGEGISLESRYSGDTLDDPVLGPPVHNQNDKDYGRPIDLVTATEDSINTVFVDLTMQIGAAKVVDALIDAGFSPEGQEDLRNNPRVTLGIGATSPLQMATAYATIAAGGRRADWYTVQSVTEPGGHVIHQANPQPRTVFTPGVVADVTYAMSQVVENGSGRIARELGRPSAGKTGTHEDLTAWYAGFTPQLSTAVALFRGEGTTAGTVSLDGVAGMDTFTGGAYPARIWTAFMKAALDGEPQMPLPERADVGEPVNPSPTPTPTPTPTFVPPPPDDSGEDGDEGDHDGDGGNDGNGGGSGSPTPPGSDETGGDDESGEWSGGEDGADEDGSDEDGNGPGRGTRPPRGGPTDEPTTAPPPGWNSTP